MFMVSARYRKASWSGEEEEAPVSVEENNKALVRKFFEEVWSKGNVAVVDGLLAPDFVDRSLLPGQGSNGFKIIIAQSSNGPKRSKLKRMSSVKPFAGPGAMPSRSVNFASRNLSMPFQTRSLV